VRTPVDISAESARRARQELEASAEVHRLVAEGMAEGVAAAADLVVDALRAGGKVMLFGNGGSAADAQHLAAELVGRFRVDRPALPALALTTDTSVITALVNDIGADAVFARQIEALGHGGDVVIAISTSGASENVLAGVASARRLGIRTIALTSERGSQLASACDLALCVPAEDTARIQEAHITLGHVLYELVETALTVS
jgi:D-sedoheptulose 7-phosphate isomerase